MISFHQETQRLAVGTNRGSIIIYDLKSASRVHVLDAFSVRRALALSPSSRLYSLACSCVAVRLSPPVFSHCTGLLC